MNRLSLSAQVTIIVVLALVLAQAISLTLTLDNRRDQMVERAVRPAAERMAMLAADPDRMERRAQDGERIERRGGEGEGRRRGGRQRIRVDVGSPIPADAPVLHDAQAAFADALAETGMDAAGAQAVRLPPRADGRDDSGLYGDWPRMMLAVPLDDGRWLSVTGPGPQPIAPVFARLLVLHLLIGLLIIVPTLFLLRKVGGSLGALATSAARFRGEEDAPPIPVEGPRDVAATIAAVNAMQARIGTMMREKDVMLGAIGHDLRTPLTALRLEAEGVDDADRRDALVAQIERLHRQFETILDLARTSRPIDRDQWASSDDVFARLRPQYEGSPVTFAPGPDTVFYGDTAASERALANLIDNALRHAGRVTVRSHSDDERVHFVVEDDGPGIPERDRERLARPFERGEASRNSATGGHGLGLAIVVAIMRRHGGALHLENRADGGAGLAARLAFARLSPR